MDISTTPQIVGVAAAAHVDVSQLAMSFEAFYRDHGDPVARALAATLSDSELAAEATNEAMTRAYQRWNKISEYDNPAAWVYRVGLNWALSLKQRRRRERDRPVQLTADQAVLGERDNSLDTALSQLSLDHRSVVVCRIHLDWSVDQTATALKIAPGTVKSRLARALEHLRNLLGTEGDQECS